MIKMCFSKQLKFGLKKSKKKKHTEPIRDILV